MDETVIPSERDLAVKTCEDCGDKRLTARTTSGRNLCSECMRRVPMENRPAVATGLGYVEETAEEEPEKSEQDSTTATEALREALSEDGGWASTTELADRTGYHIAHVREVLRKDSETLSRNRGGSGGTEWAYPDSPEVGDPAEQLPSPGGEWDGDALRNARKDAELTQSELADRAGVSQGAISKWEKRVSEPDPEAIGALKDALSTNRGTGADNS